MIFEADVCDEIGPCQGDVPKASDIATFQPRKLQSPRTIRKGVKLK